MRRALHTTLLVLMVLLAGPVALMQAAPQDSAQRSARDRWEAMSPEQRAEIAKRFEAYKGMQEGRRRELEERHGRWVEAERRAREHLPRDAQLELDGLPLGKRREVLRELAEEELAQRGRELRKRLPAEVRERLENTPREEHPAILEEFRRRHRREGMRGLLDRAERELRLGPAERRAIEALPERDRDERLIDLHARVTREEFGRDGWPEWVPAEERARFEGLAPRQFLEELHDRRRDAGEVGRPRWRDGERDAQPGGLGPRGERAPERRGLPPGLGRPDPTWRIELAELTPEQRRVAIEDRIRGRVDEFLEQHPDALTPEQRAQLDGARGRDYFETLRELGPGARDRAREAGPGRDREPGQRGAHDRPRDRDAERGPSDPTRGKGKRMGEHGPKGRGGGRAPGDQPGGKRPGR